MSAVDLGLGVAQVRVARSTHQLDAVVAFYRDGLGLPVIGGFEGHAGYDGAMIGLPGDDRHLEWTSHPAIAPTVAGPEDLLVLYFVDRARRDAAVARLTRRGHAPVAAENPYWADRAVTFADPDGFHVVLVDAPWRPDPSSVPRRFL